MSDMAGKKLAGLESGDHEFQHAEKEFFRAMAVILEHLKNRALKAEVRVFELQTELETRREQVEYMGATDRTCATCNAVLTAGPQPSATYKQTQ